MGPASAGKDSVLKYARRRLGGRYPVIFAHRYITRPLGEDIENYVALSRAEFALRKAHALFAFDWTAYGYRYGIGAEIEDWLEAGLSVVVDGSRAHFAANPALRARAVPVHIVASHEELRRRLIARRRESMEAIERRLRRAARLAPVHPRLVTIDNSGPLEHAGDAFAHLLKRLFEPRRP
jgi:ribose 1,5-bisphosphokinase